MALSVVKASGTSLGGPSTSTAQTIQPTYSPQQTVSPQANNVNPMDVYYAPTLSSGGSTSGSTGGSTGYVAPYVPPDPYAAWGGKAAYDGLVSGFDSQKSGIYNSVTDATNNTGISLNNSILDLLDSIRVGQQGIDNQGINNDLAKIRGTADVYGGINRGITSGGVALANKNANDSSAAGAIARAYGQIGQRQLSNIGNQYELQNGEIDQSQAQLDMQEQAGIRRITSSKDVAVNDIVSSAYEKLSALDAAIANANLPTRIALDAEKQRLRGETIAALAKYDAQLVSGVASINPMDRNTRVAEANKRNSLGQANPLQFNYETGAPAEFQNTGPFSSTLPIFNYRKPNEQ